MGTGTVCRVFTGLRTIAVLSLIAIIATACPAGEQPGDSPAISRQRIAEARRAPDWPSDGAVCAWGTSGTANPVVVRDPLSEDNPYLAEYGEWDLWCYKYARNDNDPAIQEYKNSEWPEEWEYLETSIDADGWMIPVLETAMTSRYFFHSRNDLYEYLFAAQGRIYGAGIMEPALKERMVEAFATKRAPFCLPVPQWLADAPPLAAMHLPDGRFACLGEPGTGGDIENFHFPSNHWVYQDQAWSIYSATGELEATGDPGDEWWQLTIPDFEERTGYAIGDLQCSTAQDYIYWYHQPTNEVGTISWDGARESAGMGFPDDERIYDTRYFETISGPELPYVHAAQQVTELIPPRGFGIGTTEITDLDLAEPIATANYAFGGATLYLQVKPIDDPDNPYSAWYEDWDFTIYNNHTRLCRDYLFNSKVLRGDYTAWDYQDILLAAGEGRRNQGFWTKQIRIDDNGYVIPQVIIATPSDPEPEINAVIEQNSLAGFYIDSPQFYDDEMEDRIRLAWAENDALTLPTLPDWLVDNPPLKVILTPDDEYVTYGPLGSGATDPPSGTDALFNQTGVPGSQPWYRYDADGNELGHVEAGDFWWELYFTNFDDELASQGYDEEINRFHEYQGYIEIYEEGRQLYGNNVIFTYKGQRVNNQWQTDNPLEFHKLNGLHLEAIRRIQREQGR